MEKLVYPVEGVVVAFLGSPFAIVVVGAVEGALLPGLVDSVALFELWCWWTLLLFTLVLLWLLLKLPPLLIWLWGWWWCCCCGMWLKFTPPPPPLGALFVSTRSVARNGLLPFSHGPALPTDPWPTAAVLATGGLCNDCLSRDADRLNSGLETTFTSTSMISEDIFIGAEVVFCGHRNVVVACRWFAIHSRSINLLITGCRLPSSSSGTL